MYWDAMQLQNHLKNLKFDIEKPTYCDKKLLKSFIVWCGKILSMTQKIFL